jgi:hypothetical protein
MPCDTASVRTARHVYFLKNSDRHPNEEQLVEYCMGADPGIQPEVKCTYISIPEPSTALGKLGNLRPLCIISRPVHMWGAEMAVNEYGLAIGNEAIFSTRVAVPEGPQHLTGMDLVRLAIERCATAESAVALIGALLQRHGQGGNCGYAELKMFYHNGFILTDPTKTLLMLTFGSHWLAIESSSIADFPHYEFPLSQTAKSGSLTSPTDFVLDESAKEMAPNTFKVSPLAQEALEKGKEVADVVTTLSNAIPESLSWTSVAQSSPGFEDFLLAQGWITQAQKESKQFSVRSALLGVWGYHKLCDQFGCGRQRQSRTEKLLNSIFCDGEVEEPSVSLTISPNAHSQEALGGRSPAHSCTLNLSTTSGTVDPAGFEARRALACFDVLRDHGDLKGEQLATSLYGANVCMHTGMGPIRINSTTASLVVILQAGPPPEETEFGLSFERKPIHVFATCTSTPCLSIFKPLSFEVGRRYLGLPSVESLDEVNASGQLLSEEEEDEFSEKPASRKVSLPKGSFVCSVVPPSTNGTSAKETFWRRAEAVFRLLSLNWKVTRSLRGSCVYSVERELVLNYFGVSSRSPARARSPSLAVRVSPSTTPTTSSLAALQLGNSRARRESITAYAAAAASPAEDLQRALEFQETSFSVHEKVLDRLKEEFEKETSDASSASTPSSGLQSVWPAVLRPRSWKSIVLYVYSAQVQRWSRQLGLPLPSSYGSLLRRRKEDAAVSAVAWVSLAACAFFLIARLRRGRSSTSGVALQTLASTTSAKPRPPPLLYFVPTPE